MKENAKSTNPFAGLRSAIKPTLGSFKSPYGIAVLASVGFHGVLFAFGPSLSQSSLASLTSNQGGESERTVPLVQLSPAEQSRLPNFSTPSLPFNLGGEGSSLTTPPPLPSLSVTPGRRPVTPRLNSPFTAPNLGNQPSRNSAFRTPFFTSPNIPTFRIPAPSRSAIVLPPRETPSNSTASTAGNRPTEDEDSMASASRNQQPPGSDNTDHTRPVQRNNSAPTMSEALEGAQAAGSETNGNNSEPETAESPVASAPSPEAQSQLAQLQAGLAFDATGTTEAEATATRNSWLATAETQSGEAELLTAETTIPMDSNLRVCVENPPVDGMVGIVVAPDGKPVAEPQLLRSTGYTSLNQAALNAIESNPFEATDSPTAYTFKIEVSYDAENCVQAEQLVQPSTAQE